MPEGDTLFRTARTLRAVMADRVVTGARGRPGGARIERLTGRRVESVTARGKHLLMGFSGGLTLHTHLGMKGAWHHYRPDEPWRRSESQAVAVIVLAERVVVCFAAPTVELIETRAVGLHPVLARLGPDLVTEEPAVAALVAVASGEQGRGSLPTVAEWLLDQTAMAGIGNVYRCEALFLEGLDPFRRLDELPLGALERCVRRAVDLMRANLDGAPRSTLPDALGALPGRARLPRTRGGSWVHRRAGRPCLRCGTLVRSAVIGTFPRRLYWCPACQAGPGVGPGRGAGVTPSAGARRPYD